MHDGNPLTELIALLCLAFLLPYILGPLFVWLTQRQRAQPQPAPFELDDPALPGEAADQFEDIDDALRPLGFEAVRGLALPSQTANVKPLVFLWVNRQEKTSVDAACMYVRTGERSRLKMSYIGLSTRLRDGTVVRTNNSPIVGAFPKRPGYVTEPFPMVKDAARLYRLHQARLEREASASPRILRLDEEFDGDAAAYLRQTMIEELEDATAAGYMQLSRDGRVYRPTCKGALLMTWGLCWPIKGIRQQRRLKRARQVMRELESQK
jgi:hypothetical protein